MSAAIELTVEDKPDQGKGASRAARRAGQMPCVIYGGKKDPVSMTVNPSQIKQQLRKDTLFTSIYDLVLDGKKTEHVIAREIQLDPVTDELLHIDFMRITNSTYINVQVPIRLDNESDCPGIKMGGILQIVRSTVELSCRAAEIPSFISVDLMNFNVGDTIRISDVTLPTGVKPAIERDFMIASIAAPRGGLDEEEAEEQNAETTEDAE